MANVEDWDQFQCVWIPSDLMLGNQGQCRGMAGMRRSRTIVDQDSLWFEGTDGSHQFVSVALGRDWIIRELAGREP